MCQGCHVIRHTEWLADHRGESLPEHLAHAAVDDQVEGTGQTHEGVDDKNYLVGDLVVEERFVTRGESVEHCDDHEGNLRHQEDGDDYDGHDGDPEGVPPLHLLPLIVPELTAVTRLR